MIGYRGWIAFVVELRRRTAAGDFTAWQSELRSGAGGSQERLVGSGAGCLMPPHFRSNNRNLPTSRFGDRPGRQRGRSVLVFQSPHFANGF